MFIAAFELPPVFISGDFFYKFCFVPLIDYYEAMYEVKVYVLTWEDIPKIIIQRKQDAEQTQALIKYSWKLNVR